MGREVGTFWVHHLCGDKSYLPHRAEWAKTWMLTRLAPDWHSHLLAFSRGFLNSLGCLGPVDSQYGVTSATASRAWTPFPDLCKWETTESWIQMQAFCDGRHVSKAGSRSFCVSSCIMGMWWLNGTWSCTQGFLGYVDCYWWGQDCKEEAPFSPLPKPRPSLSEELEG